MSAIQCGILCDAVLEDATEKFINCFPDPDFDMAYRVVESDFENATKDSVDVTSGILLDWFDAMGLAGAATAYDEQTAQRLKEFAKRYHPTEFPNYGVWVTFRDLECPNTKRVLVDQAKIGIKTTMRGLPQTTNRMSELKMYLADDFCGDELWDYLVHKASFPAEMLETMQPLTIIHSPFFPYLLELGGRKKKKHVESSSLVIQVPPSRDPPPQGKEMKRKKHKALTRSNSMREPYDSN